MLYLNKKLTCSLPLLTIDSRAVVPLLKTIDSDTHEHAGDMMRLALYTGMRRGEMFRLRWQDVEFERGFIHLTDTKGGLDQRIPLNDAARELLLKRPRKQKCLRLSGSRRQAPKGHQQGG